MPPIPRISFGIIVLNGEPFTRYCVRALYPFAYQIIVAEGAAPGARGVAGPDGHSSDGTLEVLRDLIAHEDPQGKITLITAEDHGHPDGFWPGEKHEQSQAYAARASGDWLWQVDIDEFYHPADMTRLFARLAQDETVGAAAFPQRTFFGGFDHTVDGPYCRFEPGVGAFHRLFRWGPGYRYTTHRPPTVVDERGIDVRRRGLLDGSQLQQMGIFMYHYSLVFPKQVDEKCRYYESADWCRRQGARQWAHDVFDQMRRPFRVHNVHAYPSWLSRFEGEHPPQIEALRRDLAAGRLDIAQRRGDDLPPLVASARYRLGRGLLKMSLPLWWLWFRAARTPVRMIRHPRWALGELRRRFARA